MQTDILRQLEGLHYHCAKRPLPQKVQEGVWCVYVSFLLEERQSDIPEASFWRGALHLRGLFVSLISFGRQSISCLTACKSLPLILLCNLHPLWQSKLEAWATRLGERSDSVSRHLLPYGTETVQVHQVVSFFLSVSPSFLLLFSP